MKRIAKQTGPGQMVDAREAPWCPDCKGVQMDVVSAEMREHWRIPSLKAIVVEWRCPRCSLPVTEVGLEGNDGGMK